MVPKKIFGKRNSIEYWAEFFRDNVSLRVFCRVEKKLPQRETIFYRDQQSWMNYLCQFPYLENMEVSSELSLAFLDLTVAGSCSGSPTITSLLKPRQKGIRPSGSMHWLASSIMHTLNRLKTRNKKRINMTRVGNWYWAPTPWDLQVGQGFRFARGKGITVSVKKICGVLFFYSCAVYIAVTSYKTAMKKILLLCDMWWNPVVTHHDWMVLMNGENQKSWFF